MPTPSTTNRTALLCLGAILISACTGGITFGNGTTSTSSGQAQATEPTGTALGSTGSSGAREEVELLPEGGFGTGRILFVRRNARTRGWSHGGDLWVLDASSGRATRLTDGGDHQDPRWSPDGARVVFAALSDRASVSRLFTIAADGTALRPLTGREAIVESWPAWSPDGRSLTFASHPRGRGEYALFRVRSDGTGLRPLGLPNASESVWAQDGRALVFVSYANAPNAQTSKIYVASSEGGAPRRLTDLAPSLSEEGPRLSPDGLTIAFRTHVYDAARNAIDPASSFTIRLDGSDLRDLNRRLDVAPRSPGLVPFWSPDMRRIAYVVDGAILVTDAEGSGRRTLAAGLAVAGDLAWSPDGKMLAFRGGWLEGRELYVVDVDSERVLRITTSGDVDGHMNGLEWFGAVRRED